MTEKNKGWWKSLQPWEQFYIQIMCFFVLPIYFFSMDPADTEKTRLHTFMLFGFAVGLFGFFWLVAHVRGINARAAQRRLEQEKIDFEAGVTPPKRSDTKWRYLGAAALVILGIVIVKDPSYTKSWLPVILWGVALILAREVGLFLLGGGILIWLFTSAKEAWATLTTPHAIILGAIIIAYVIYAIDQDKRKR